MGNQILGLVLAIIAGCGSSIVVGLATRPKTRAEAGQVKASGEVLISADARAWAERFAQETTAAKLEAADCRRRLDELEVRFDAAIEVIRDQTREIVGLGGHPKPYPRELIPPLGPFGPAPPAANTG